MISLLFLLYMGCGVRENRVRMIRQWKASGKRSTGGVPACLAAAYLPFDGADQSERHRGSTWNTADDIALGIGIRCYT
jgi:hypothetical protein